MRIKQIETGVYEVGGKRVKVFLPRWDQNLTNEEYRALKAYREEEKARIEMDIKSIPFGKYKGVPIYQLKSQEGFKYLTWLVSSHQWEQVPKVTQDVILGFIAGTNDGM